MTNVDTALMEQIFDLPQRYRMQQRDIHRESICIIAVGGKTNMDKPGFVFRKLGIPTYLVFDNDKSKGAKKQKPHTNILLQKICGVSTPKKWPNGVKAKFTAVEGNLEIYLKSQLGDAYRKIFDVVASKFGLNYDEIKKTPAAISSVFLLAHKDGFTFPLFDKVIKKVDSLKS